MTMTTTVLFVTDPETDSSNDAAIAALLPGYPVAISQGATMDAARQHLFEAVADLVDAYNATIAARIAEYQAEGAIVKTETVTITIEAKAHVA